MQIDEDSLRLIINPVHYKSEQLYAIIEALNHTFSYFAIDTPIRICHFLAQVLHESSAFRYTTEIWGNTKAQLAYDTRIDLGNTPEVDGDGYKYRGRGWIQVTGGANYALAAKELDINCLNDPDLLSRLPYSAVVSGWFWKKRNLNQFADVDDIMSITRRVNGGFNGLDDRKMWLVKAKNVFTI